MAVTEKVKTGTDFTVRLDLTVEGEVITALPQIFVQFYYELNGQIFPFSFFAKDLNTTKILAKIADGLIIRQMLFDGEIIVCEIPLVDTETLKIEICKEVEVFAEISFIDSDGDVQKFTEEDDEGNECDKFIVDLEKSSTEGFL